MQKKIASREIGRNRVELWYFPEGTEIVAGSGSRIQEEDGWLARSTDGATSHGGWYNTLEKAQERYERLVKHEESMELNRLIGTRPVEV